MLDVRARICINSAYVLARALTISVRYSCVRARGFIDNFGKSPLEYSVMEYPTQQRVLMPLLSMAYALHFTGLDVKESYRKYIVEGDSSLLSELHASSAGLKAYITTHVSEGMESCRKMCEPCYIPVSHIMLIYAVLYSYITLLWYCCRFLELPWRQQKLFVHIFDFRPPKKSHYYTLYFIIQLSWKMIRWAWNRSFLPDENDGITHFFTCALC